MMVRRDEAPVAHFSPNRRYRYSLRRRVGFGNRVVAFCMLNPSTADEERNDPTVRRCIDYANRWGFGWLIVVNLAPFRSSQPEDMIAAGPEPDDIWESNIAAIMAAAQESDLLVLAYGNHGVREDRAGRVLEVLAAGKVEAHCLGVTLQGQPIHPLYQRSSALPVPYDPSI